MTAPTNNESPEKEVLDPCVDPQPRPDPDPEPEVVPPVANNREEEERPIYVQRTIESPIEQAYRSVTVISQHLNQPISDYMSEYQNGVRTPQRIFLSAHTESLDRIDPFRYSIGALYNYSLPHRQCIPFSRYQEQERLNPGEGDVSKGWIKYGFVATPPEYGSSFPQRNDTFLRYLLKF